MIGVRQSCRGSDVFPRDYVRSVFVVAALVAAGAGLHRPPVHGADSKAKVDLVDPFLEEDTAPPAFDEIPEIPDLEENPRPANKGPRKPPAKTPPAEDVSEDPEIPDLELPAKPATRTPPNPPAKTAPVATEPESPELPEMELPPKPPTEAVPGSQPKVPLAASPSASANADPEEETPEVLTPRVTRDIKQTAPPKPDQTADSDLPDQKPMGAELPPMKRTPLAGPAGWKSPPGDPARPPNPNGDKLSGSNAEGARFENDDDFNQQIQSGPLAGILIEGNKTIKTETIMAELKTRVGRVAEANVIKEDIRTLMKKRWFFSVESRVAPSKAGPVLVFRVVERPILQKVTYLGNTKFKEKVLADLTGLKAGSAYDVGANRESARRIENHYREKGYLYVTVELEKGSLPEEREVVFKIDEGPKVVVTKIGFKGNKFVESGVLKQHVKTKKQILWLFGGKYDPATIPDDIIALKQYYQDLGFFDVQIKNEEWQSEDKGKIHILYVIDEGVRFKVRNIEFVGSRVIPEDKLRDKMKVKENDFYNQRFVNADQEKIVAQYGELGRIFATVEPKYRTFEEPGFVDLVYAINEDQPYRIGPIHVHINGEHPHTKESVVLTKLTFKPGELASRAKIKQSEQRLKNTQIFAGGMPGAQQQQQAEPPRIDIPFPDGTVPRRPQSQARAQNDVADATPSSRTTPVEPAEPVFVQAPPLFPTTTPENNGFNIFRAQNAQYDDPQGNSGFDDSPDGMPTEPVFPEEPQTPYIEPNVYVSEGQTGSVMLGVGVNSNAGLVGSAVLQENNFDLFRPPTSMQDIIDGTAFRGGGQQFRLEAVPGIQLSRYLVSWTDPYFLDQNLMFGVSGSYYTRYFTNGNEIFWTETREGGTVRAGHQFTPTLSGTVAVKAENVDITNPEIPTPPTIASVLGNNFLSTARFGLIHDTRDSSFLPGRGHYIDFSYEQGIANFVFPKVDLQAKQYFLVKERPDGGSRQVISLTGNVGWTGNQTPYFERFYAGGFTSFRGFYFYGVSPRTFGVPTGGFFQALGSLEYLHPITADNMVQVVTFTDFGTVDQTVTLDAFRLSIGAGVRLTVPMMGPVPIAVDFAIPLLKQPFDQTQVISFSLGLLR
jgi:outer membrane protein insertion porin family